MFVAGCAGLVLAGGRSSRMGCDKAELMRGDKTMLQYSEDLLAQAGLNRVIVSRNLGNGVTDVVSDKGPLGGIYSVIKRHPDIGALLITAVDMPLLSVDDLIMLLLVGPREGRPLCYQDSFFPMFLPVSPQLADYLEQQLFNEGGNLKVKDMVQALGGGFVRYEDHEDRLVNTNTPEQWQACQSKWES